LLKTSRFDVGIIGGGPAGSAAALTLACRGLTVVLFERSSYESRRVGETVPPEIRQPLSRLGVWDAFERDGHLRISGITSLWGSDRPAETDFVFSPYGNGWTLDRRRFDRSLADAAQAAGVRLLCSTRVVRCEKNVTGTWTIESEKDRKSVVIQASFLLNATGRFGSVTGLKSSRIYVDRLVSAVSYHSLCADTISAPCRPLVEACEHGWWYSARLPNCEVIFAFMTDADGFAGWGEARNSRWQHRLSTAPHTRSRFMQCVPHSEIRVLSAATSCAHAIGGLRWLNIGDAAITMDPLSGRGVFDALNTGIAAAEVVAAVPSQWEQRINQHIAEAANSLKSSLQIRAGYYRNESRWPLSPFWLRRKHITGSFTSEIR
jgi:2-polyprenyl-6-methoxyphenol hydroxylase-like FAD-dependent oxidoreductase